MPKEFYNPGTQLNRFLTGPVDGMLRSRATFAGKNTLFEVVSGRTISDLIGLGPVPLLQSKPYILVLATGRSGWVWRVRGGSIKIAFGREIWGICT